MWRERVCRDCSVIPIYCRNGSSPAVSAAFVRCIGKDLMLSLGFLSPHYLQRHLLLHFLTAESPLGQVAVEVGLRHISIVSTEYIAALSLRGAYSGQAPDSFPCA